MGLEPTTPGTTIRCSNQLSYTHQIYGTSRKENGTPEGTRTPGLLLRRQLLYPAELLAHSLERVTRIELASPAWKAGALTIVLHPHSSPTDKGHRNNRQLGYLTMEDSICQYVFFDFLYLFFSVRGTKFSLDKEKIKEYTGKKFLTGGTTMRRYVITMNNAPMLSGNADAMQIGLTLSYPVGGN